MKFDMVLGNIKSVFLIEDGIPQIIASNGIISLKNNPKFIRFEVIGEKSSLYTNPILKSNNPEFVVKQVLFTLKLIYPKRFTSDFGHSHCFQPYLSCYF
ncbi:MAG: hypothetical protein IPH28_23555 [Cytophagaceae bacterium]|nr:hypothetical protein [Cytophagaceae bacterium]